MRKRRLPADVHAELLVRARAVNGSWVPTTASLLYTARDPYAVTLTIYVPDREPVEWVFGRDLLDDGIEDATSNDGDIVMWRTGADEDGVPDGDLHIRLQPPDQEPGYLITPCAPVTKFLQRTLDAVRFGDEKDYYCDIESELEGLLEES